MDDVLLVRRRDRIRDRDHDVEGLLRREAVGSRTEELLEILTREELLNDEGRAVVIARDVEHVDHVGVTNRGGRARLAEEAHHVLLVARVLLVQDLDRDLATQRDVRRTVDFAHPADAEALVEQVLAAEEVPLARPRFFRCFACHFSTRL